MQNVVIPLEQGVEGLLTSTRNTLYAGHGGDQTLSYLFC